MKEHLTEKELIEYQFKLASDIRMEEVSSHLESCAMCREYLERLKRKFSALDLLREDVKISEDLVSNVVEQAQGGVGNLTVKKRLLRFAHKDEWRWVGAVAAVLMVGLTLLVANLARQGRRYGPVKKPGSPIVEKPADTLRPQSEARRMLFARDEKKADAADEFEQPPFAPASAIELVVLPRRDNVQITIYNSADLTLVRERRNLTLKKGWNWLQFMWANTLIDPTSLSLEPLEKADKVDIQQLVFPARLREVGRWLIRSEVSGRVPFEITYFTSGLSWRAFYMGTLSQDERKMDIQGYVRVGNNSGEDYENAQTRLIVGKVHLLDEIAELARRPYPYGWPFVRGDRIRSISGALEVDSIEIKDRLVVAGFFDDEEIGRKEIKKEGLSEYFLYTIEGTETIPDKWGKRLLSFEAEDINVTSLYKYDEERWGNQTIRFVSFANDEKHNLGKTPIPNGSVKIFSQADEPVSPSASRDGQGYLSYVGGTGIKYIPVNEDIELNLGPARLVKVEPTLMDFRTDNYVFGNEGNVSGWDEIRTWQIEITNTRELPIEIEITRGFGTAYWTLQTDITYHGLPARDSTARMAVVQSKHDATHARFNLNLEPRSKRIFEYTVTTYHGAREETFIKSKEQEKM